MPKTCTENEFLGGIGDGKHLWELLSVAYVVGRGSSLRVMTDKVLSVPKCVRLARMSLNSQQLRSSAGTQGRGLG